MDNILTYQAKAPTIMLCTSLISLALYTAGLQAATAPSEQQQLAALQAAEASAHQQWIDDRPEAAIRTLAQAIGKASAVETGPLPSAQADELEYALLLFQRYGEELRNLTLQRQLLEGVEIPPQNGAAHARLAWLREDSAEQLGVLQSWQFIGPFDNERGAGMETQLPPETNPDADAIHEGKVREVSWRSLPWVEPAQGVLRFESLLDPVAQAAVLARTWVRSDTEQAALLMLGFSDEARAWVNGQAVLDSWRSHSFRRDAYAVPVQLHPGWNELVIKLGSRNNPARMVVRLADALQASPLHLESRAEAPEGVEALVLSAEPAPDIGHSQQNRPGLHSRLFQQIAHSETASVAAMARAWYRASVLEAATQAAPRHLHPGRSNAQTAVRLMGDHPAYRLQLARTLSQRTLLSTEKDINPWLKEIDQVLQLDPGQPLALRLKANHAWTNQPTYDRALALLDNAAERLGPSILAQSSRAKVLGRMRQYALADGVLRNLYEQPAVRNYPSVLAQCMAALPEGRRQLDDYRYILDAHYTPKVINQYAARLRLLGQERPGQLTELHESLRWNPWSLRARLNAAKFLLEQNDPSGALGLLDEALAFAPERANLHKYRARALWMNGDKDGAITALETELRYDFNAEDEQRLLDFLRSQGATPFQTEFQQSLAEVLAQVGDRASTDPAISREVLLKRVVIQVQPDGTAKRYTRLVQRVLNENGARELDRMPFYAAPGDQEVRVLKAQVLHPDGSLDEARTGRSGWRGRMAIDLPPLGPGDVVDIEYRLDDLRTTFFGQYFAMNEAFSQNFSLPTWRSDIILIVPDSFPLKLHQRSFSGQATSEHRQDQKQVVYSWTMENLAPIRFEAGMPPAQEFLPAIQATSYASWDAFSNWWWNLIKDEVRVSPDMRAKVAELIVGLDRPIDKMRAIYDFVVTDIRYNAWEFGVHGYRPYSAPAIFSRGFGDCKDKAILLRAMLGEADIEALPVLIKMEQRRPEEDLTLAMVSHFNHCIAYVPEQPGIPEMYLDGTARLHPMDVLPDSDLGAQVLVVGPGFSQRRRIPFAQADRNHIRQEFDVYLDEEGGPMVRYSRISEGSFDVADRRSFTGSAEERLEKAERLLTSLFGPLNGSVVLESVPDFEDLDADIRMTFVARPNNIGRPAEGGFELPTTFDKLNMLQAFGSEKDRDTDLLLGAPWTRSTEIRYHLPQEANAHLIDGKKIDLAGAGYTFQTEIDNTVLTIKEEFQLRSHRIDQAKYQEFRETCRTVDDIQNQFIKVEVRL
jgi:tetratricopeptide (TPR) repeat protein